MRDLADDAIWKDIDTTIGERARKARRREWWKQARPDMLQVGWIMVYLAVAMGDLMMWMLSYQRGKNYVYGAIAVTALIILVIGVFTIFAGASTRNGTFKRDWWYPKVHRD
jgi:uncharacterized membrane protein YcjF (UPF0283 family)